MNLRFDFCEKCDHKGSLYNALSWSIGKKTGNNFIFVPDFRTECIIICRLSKVVIAIT